MDYKEEIREIREKLKRNSYLYYVLDAPTMDDYEYDLLNRRLEELEAEHPEEITPDSPTQNIGGKILKDFPEFKHEVPLESLQDVFNAAELAEFCAKLEQGLGKEAIYSVEPKVDGLSVAIEYRDGVFVAGATRGDGYIGEDVTENIRTIQSLPKTLPDKLPHLIVRGEVYMSREVFEEINTLRELQGEQLLANPRNAAAGSLRQLDPTIAAQRKLDIQIFNLQLADGKIFTTHSETLDYLASQNFPVIPHKTITGIENVQAEIDRINDERLNYPYDIDGGVVKLNALSDRLILGSTAKFPKWAIAFKYPPEQKPSKVKEIVVQVGRTGVLTPKAILEPVRLAGSTVTSATLHNQDYVTEKDIRVGDTVTVQKAGEIIPEIVEVDFSKRPEGTSPYILPKVCPVCGAPVQRDEDGAAIRCTGAECPAQLMRNITHFASHDAMDIDGLGPAVAQQFVENNLVTNVADIYHLRREDIAKLEHMGEKSADNLLQAIEHSKSKDLSKLIYALGIRQVGEKAAQILAVHFKTMDAFINASEEELTQIRDIGVITAKNILAYLTQPQSQDLIKRLKEAGVRMESNAPPLVNDRLVGMTFVLTGTLNRFDRKAAQKLIEERGGNVVSTVSKNTNYVVVGENPGSKLQKAQELDISILNEEEFIKMLEI